MLETVLNHLHNWFPVKGAARAGTFKVVSGVIAEPELQIADGQYYRVCGSVFNDGLHVWGTESDLLTDETFEGEVWPLAIPKAVINLSIEIKDWCEKNPATDKVSESFGGYSYTRGTNGGGSADGGWSMAFRTRLNAWKKVG